MARPKKEINNTEKNVNSINKTVQNSSKGKEDSILKLENEKLKNELDEIKLMLKNLTQAKQSPINVTEDINNSAKIGYEEDNFEIEPNKYIKVMSLNFGKLVLNTESKGQGKSFVFNKFGDIRNIIYSDLSNLYHHQQSFAEQGRFYIFDKKFIKNHGLESYYNKFLTKETIENILDNKSNEIVDLFNNTSEAQKEIIVNLLIKKITNGENVDISKADIISRIYGQNIYDIARAKMNNNEIEE
jgi:regulator of replication initiation timing